MFKISDEDLMEYADNTLSNDKMDKLRVVIEQDAELIRRVEDFQASLLLATLAFELRDKKRDAAF